MSHFTELLRGIKTITRQHIHHKQPRTGHLSHLTEVVIQKFKVSSLLENHILIPNWTCVLTVPSYSSCKDCCCVLTKKKKFSLLSNFSTVQAAILNLSALSPISWLSWMPSNPGLWIVHHAYSLPELPLAPLSWQQGYQSFADYCSSSCHHCTCAANTIFLTIPAAPLVHPPAVLDL